MSIANFPRSTDVIGISPSNPSPRLNRSQLNAKLEGAYGEITRKTYLIHIPSLYLVPAIFHEECSPLPLALTCSDWTHGDPLPSLTQIIVSTAGNYPSHFSNILVDILQSNKHLAMQPRTPITRAQCTQRTPKSHHERFTFNPLQ